MDRKEACVGGYPHTPTCATAVPARSFPYSWSARADAARAAPCTASTALGVKSDHRLLLQDRPAIWHDREMMLD